MTQVASASASDLWDQGIVQSMKHDGLICRRVHTREAYASELHRHIGIGIVYCARGQGTFSLGDLVLPYSTGQLIYFDSSVPHQVNMGAAYERWDICLWPDVATELLRSGTFHDLVGTFYPGPGTVRAFSIPETERRRLQRLFKDLHYESKQRQMGFNLYLHCKLIELFILLQRSSELPVRPSRRSASSSGLAEILSYIDEQIPHNPSVESVARAFHYSPSQLYRIIRSGTGKSPSQYIRSRRVDRAKKLLVSGDLTVGAIALAVGSPTVAHFCTIFREATGSTPGDYRSSHRLGARRS